MGSLDAAQVCLLGEEQDDGEHRQLEAKQDIEELIGPRALSRVLPVGHSGVCLSRGEGRRGDHAQGRKVMATLDVEGFASLGQHGPTLGTGQLSVDVVASSFTECADHAAGSDDGREWLAPGNL